MAHLRPMTPSQQYNSVPNVTDTTHLSRGYGDSSHLNVDANDFATTPANPVDSSPLSQSMQHHHTERLGRFEEQFDARTRGSSVLADGEHLQRSTSRASTLNQGAAPSRSGTLKKRSSVKRSGSLKRSGSRKSVHAGSIRGVSIEDDERGSSLKHNSVFYTPVPTTGTPTEVLANRFQAWRKLLKDLITYFREVAVSYEQRAKSLLKVSNVINNTNASPIFMTEGGLNDANRILRDFHKQSVSEAHKARDIENEVINQLSGLRNDLGQKIKEIKSLSGDFKNSVEKEKETTRKCVAALEEALALVDTDPSAVAGKGDPYVVRLAVDRQIEKQIDEENYLHRAYLNLENSGRELESIVVGEIQKAYNALANIFKRDADEMYSTIERLRSGPVGMPRDLEWNQFVRNDPHFVDPDIPLRRLEEIEYPGKHHPATTEVRAGMLERKSKYLKSYTPGWYVLSPTHLHEFKSADRIYTQPPVMSLYLPDQKLGSHSQPGSSSHKFVLKGRQTGSMHRGHTWVFRAETYDTMLAWYEDVKVLTEKSGEERNAFVRRHIRSHSQSSARSVASSDGELEEDEADAVPYSANQSLTSQAVRDEPPQRPSPGGRFPSDLQVDHSLHAPLSPSSGSSEIGNDLTTASGGLQGTYPSYPTDQSVYPPNEQNSYPSQNAYGYTPDPTYLQQQPLYSQDTYNSNANPANLPQNNYPTVPNAYDTSAHQMPQEPSSFDPQSPLEKRDHDSTYREWLAPAAGGAAAGVLGAEAYRKYREPQDQKQDAIDDSTQTPQATVKSAFEQPIDRNATPVPDPVNAPAPGSESGGNSLATTPDAYRQSFLVGTEAVPASASSNIANGGPESSRTTDPVFPRMHRQDTDISVSDLHVPGGYPKVTAA